MYHQNILAQVNDGSRRRAVSQTFSPRDELVRLPPEHHLREVAEVPAVADDAVLARQQAGENVACAVQVTAGVMARIGAQRAVARERVQVRRVGAEQRVRQPDDVEDRGRVHAAISGLRLSLRSPRSTELASNICDRSIAGALRRGRRRRAGRSARRTPPGCPRRSAGWRPRRCPARA